MAEFNETPVYIIDDDQNIVLIVRKALELDGYKKIQVAENGTEAVDLLRLPSENKDNDTVQMSGMKVVILDIMLPDINGFELCARIKQTHPDTLVVLISGFNIDDLNEKIIECDADDFLTKPFSPIELVARINLLIKKYMNYSRNSAANTTASIYNSSDPAMPNMVPHIGDSLDNLQIIDSLGWGKSSIIYKVIDKKNNKIFAVKLLTRNALEFNEVVRRFEHEVNIMARLDHPNIIKFHRMSNYKGCPYILMDYVYGINLEEYIVTKGHPGIPLLLDIMEQAASAVSEIHKHGIIHRDIKLKNLMLELGSNKIKLTDFGIAMLITEDPMLTKDGYIVGTPIYMAPEMFRGEAATVASDIYSFGVTFYHLAAGMPPYVARSNTELYKMHRENTPQAIHKVFREIPKGLENLIIKQCMAKKPSDRPQSMKDILEKLNAIRKKHHIPLV